MNQSNAFSLRSRKYLLSPKGNMAIEISQNKEISGGWKNGRRKEIGFAILQKRANRGSIQIKK